MEIKGRHISTKALGFITTVTTVLSDEWANLGLSDWKLGCITAIACAYILAQGFKDFGKEAAKIKIALQKGTL